MEQPQTNNKLTLPGAIIIAGAIVAIAVIFKWQPSNSGNSKQSVSSQVRTSTGHVTVASPGTLMPAVFESQLADTLVKNGIIDPNKLPQVSELNLLWAFGLANKNDVLTNGPIMDPRYGGPTNMASVGGWTASTGDVTDHFNMHEFMTLTPEEQALVEKVAKKTFRPCCKNSTYFPDCNHGMAMLGLLEILATKGGSEQDLVAAATKANLIWFPQQQQTNCGIQDSQTGTIPPAPASQPNCGLGA